jgi:hypothetical protein
MGNYYEFMTIEDHIKLEQLIEANMDGRGVIVEVFDTGQMIQRITTEEYRSWLKTMLQINPTFLQEFP